MYAGLTVVLPQGDFLSKQYVFVQKNKGDNQMKWYKKSDFLRLQG